MFLRMTQHVRAVIRKWGNSPAVRLNAAVMQQADFTLEQPVQLKVSRGRIVIEPAQSTDFRLEDLVAATMCQKPEISFGCNLIRRQGTNKRGIAPPWCSVPQSITARPI